MGTKSNRSSGTQITQRGVNQGNVLVDPVTGLPVNTVVDGSGVRRLAVDAQFTADIGDLNVDLDGTGPNGDSVFIVDNVSGNKLKINADGSIDSNVKVDAADGDNIAITSSSGNELNINPDGSVDVNVNGLTLPLIDNITVSTANSEESYPLPANTKKFCIRARGKAKLQLAYVSGESGTKYRTIFPGNSYEEIGISASAITLYFQSNKSGEVVEITSWT